MYASKTVLFCRTNEPLDLHRQATLTNARLRLWIRQSLRRQKPGRELLDQ